MNRYRQSRNRKRRARVEAQVHHIEEMMAQWQEDRLLRAALSYAGMSLTAIDQVVRLTAEAVNRRDLDIFIEPLDLVYQRFSGTEVAFISVTPRAGTAPPCRFVPAVA